MGTAGTCRRGWRARRAVGLDMGGSLGGLGGVSRCAGKRRATRGHRSARPLPAGPRTDRILVLMRLHSNELHRVVLLLAIVAGLMAFGPSRVAARACERLDSLEPQLAIPEGRAVRPGQRIDLAWNSTDSVSELEILLSVDGGRHFSACISPRLEPGRRHFLWRVPREMTGDLQLRIRYNRGGREIEGPPTGALCSLADDTDQPEPMALPPAGSSAAPSAPRPGGSPTAPSPGSTGAAAGAPREDDSARKLPLPRTDSFLQSSFLSSSRSACSMSAVAPAASQRLLPLLA